MTLVLGYPYSMIISQLLHVAVTQLMDASIADMKQVRGGRLDDHGAECTHVTLFSIIAVLALARLGIQPGISSHQHTLGGLLDRPGIGGAEIVFQKACNGGLAGNLTYLAAADAIGQGDRNALGAELGFTGNADAVKVLVDGFPALVGTLS